MNSFLGIVYVCGSADCDEKTFYAKLGDNAYTDLKIDFIINDTSTVDYVKPHTDKVRTVISMCYCGNFYRVIIFLVCHK